MTVERPLNTLNGWFALFAILAAAIAAVWIFAAACVAVSAGQETLLWYLFLFGSVGGFICCLICFAGLFAIQPNESMVGLLAGAYVGTVRTPGFHFSNPFLTRKKVSLRARTMEATKLKVNDKQGSPIEISAVVFWAVENTAAATFDVENYAEYVHVQAESSLRQLASHYAYDHGEEHEITLRSGMDEVAATMKAQLQQRVSSAGLVVLDTRLTHLAYAPEIASAMLRRQQAEAVVAARKTIVHGAVSIVEMALNDLAARNLVELDPERKAAMVSNLLVVLCGETQAQPVINTGTLYT